MATEKPSSSRYPVIDSRTTPSEGTRTYNRRRGSPSEECTGRSIRRKVEQKLQLHILLPNGSNITLFEEKDDKLRVDQLLRKIRCEVEQDDECERGINWGGQVYLEDTSGNKIEDGNVFDWIHTISNTLVLQDGAPNAVHTHQNMWNVTPDPELLGALPQEYTLETALADILDNSLQAVWGNLSTDRRLISVTLSKDKITIFDSGQGMDSSMTNSIAKWGTMGSSKHRSVRASAIGGDPPFLKPFFGMYGFGGLLAAMHIGGVAVVSSKTKSSKKVVTLTLEKDKLMERCKSERTWMTPGEYREPTTAEIRKSPHGSFTKVELSKLKRKVWREHQIRCLLKDIYFPYIQCDLLDSSQKTTTPVEFEVNDMNLAEVEGGEVAVTNLSSCNGSPFIIDLHMKKTSHDVHSGTKPNDADKGNARITCFYYPIKQGKEIIDGILEELEKQQIGINENFENFCRVSIRRLGRLLPDARWRRLPFMEPKRKRGEKANVPKVCFERVKAFVDTDAGFVPTTSKMDLSSGHSFTSALRNLGSRGVMQDGVEIEILRGKRSITATALDKEFEDWVKEMHELFDEEMDYQNDPDAIIMSNMPELNFSQDVFRVYKHMKRKGILWKQGMRVKFFKGTPGHLNKDFYATLEYFLSEGLSEDRGNTKVICRPIEVSKEAGSTLSLKDGDAKFDLGKSKALSIDFLSLDKCINLDENGWNRQVEKRILKSPDFIEILEKESLEKLGLSGGLARIVKAGYKPPCEICAVVRPKHYKRLLQERKMNNPIDQKNILKQAMQMTLEVKHMESHNPVCSRSCVTMLVSGKSVNGIQGLYCFCTEGIQFENIFRKTGRYSFLFSLVEDDPLDSTITATLEVDVLPSEKIGRWDLRMYYEPESQVQDNIVTTRLGSDIGPLVLSCYDEFDNLKRIMEPINLDFKVWSNEKLLDIEIFCERMPNKGQSRHADHLIIKAVKFLRGTLVDMPADYRARLKLAISNKAAASLEFILLPGEMAAIKDVESQLMENCLQREDVIQDLTLQAIDSWGNSVEKGCPIVLQLDGLDLQDKKGNERKVDDKGCINLGGLLKVTGPFNSKAKISVYTGTKKQLFEREFSLLQRTLQIISMVPNECSTGGTLEKLEVSIIDENRNVDKNMDGPCHMIMLDSSSYNAYHPLKKGTCFISRIQLPRNSGPWRCRIYHLMHQELAAELEVNLISAPPLPLSSFTCENDVPENDEPLRILDRASVEEELIRTGDSIIYELEILEMQMKKNATKVSKAEMELSALEKEKESAVHCILQLEGEIKTLEAAAPNTHPDKLGMNNVTTISDQSDLAAEHVAERIVKLGNHPCRFFMEAQCPGKFLSRETGRAGVNEILGVVSLLASVENQLLSKSLAEFIGQENMLAIVCKTQKAADLVVRYNDGKVDEHWGLYKFAQSRKKTMHGRLRLYILQEMRSLAGRHESNHSQNLLTIDAPRLGNGASPAGFLGYAVNLLYLNREHLDLRASLFYNLFKELQVYDTLKNLLRAKSSLTSGGVSLDGGLIRGHGCEDFGSREEEAIISFPVLSKNEKMSGNSSLHPMEDVYRCFLQSKKRELQDRSSLKDEIEARAEYVRQKLATYKRKHEETKAEMVSQTNRKKLLLEKLNSLK